MEGLIKEVFIKEATDTHSDVVFIVKNLPKRFIYRMVPKQIPRYDRDGYTDGVVMNDPNGAKEEALLEGLEKSRSGDGSVVFNMKQPGAQTALTAIDAFVKGTLPRDVVLPTRVPYAARPDVPSSNPLPYSQIPIVELPMILKPDAPQVSPQGVLPLPAGSGPVMDVEAVKKAAVDEYKQMRKDAAARARAGKEKRKAE